MKNISDKSYQNLFNLAVEFKDLAPWKWIKEYNFFGFQVPGNKDIHYCSIMGHLGEHYSLSVYSGPAGFQSYAAMQSYEGEYPYDVFLRQNCLMLSFEDRKFLEKDDLGLIKRLGLKFRGKNAWPMFRYYEPEMVPRFLETEQQIELLSTALEQTVHVSKEFKGRTDEIFIEGDEQLLIRTAEQSAGGLKWLNKRQPLPDNFEIAPPKQIIYNSIKAELLRQTLDYSENQWIVDYSILPVPIFEPEVKDTAFYPRSVLIIDMDKQFILHNRMTNNEEFPLIFNDEFLNTIERAGQIPDVIVCTHIDACMLLEPLAEQLDIEIICEMNNPLLDSIMNEFVNMSSNQNF
jgi:hypothetical protein